MKKILIILSGKASKKNLINKAVKTGETLFIKRLTFYIIRKKSRTVLNLKVYIYYINLIVQYNKVVYTYLNNLIIYQISIELYFI